MTRLFGNTTLAERRRGCIFSEDFLNTNRVTENEGIIVGSPTINKGVTFDGINNKYIHYTNNPFVNGQPANWTFMFRFIANDPNNPSAKGMIQGGSVANSSPVITVLNGKVIYYANSSQFKYGATTIVAGQEYHVAITSNGTIAGTNIYLNGKLDNGTSTSSGAGPVAFSYLMFGKRGLTSSAFFDGQLKSLKIYNRQITQREIYNDYIKYSNINELVYQDDFSTDKWTNANVTKELLPSWQGETNVMKITTTSSTGITISPNPAIATEVGKLYRARLRVWVPSVNGNVYFYWNTAITSNPRQTTTLRDQWVDIDIFFMAIATTTILYLNTETINKIVYCSDLKVEVYNEKTKSVDLVFKPVDNNGTRIINHADATNPMIADTGVSVASQLKRGGLLFNGTTQGMVSTNTLSYKYHGVETFIVGFQVKPKGGNYYILSERTTSAVGMALLLNETNNNIEIYFGTTAILTIPYYASNVLIIRRVMNSIDVWLNGILLYSNTTFDGRLYSEGMKLYLGKRGESTSLLFNNKLFGLKILNYAIDYNEVQKFTYEMQRDMKGGEPV